MANANVRGRFVWHELYTPNPEGAREFYGKVVGWRVEPWPPDPSYLMFTAPRGPLGAAVEAREGTPLWVPYIGTIDVDECIAGAQRLGGRVQTPATDMPGGGRYAVLIDPQGATFGIYASPAAQPEQPPGIAEFSWHELATTVAPGIAFGFYGALFDWDEIEEHDLGPMGRYLVFGRRGRRLGGMYDKGPERPGPAYWLGYVSIADLEDTVEQAKAAHGSLLAGPMDVPGGDRVAQLMDPYGAFFALHKAASAAAAAPARGQPKRTAAASGTQAARKARATKKRPAKKRPAKKRAAKKAPAKRKARTRKPAAKRAKAAPRKRAGRKTARKKTAARRTAAARPGSRRTKKRRRS
jgi:predicted enzyme related to lactoylglutathione lyase